MEPAEMKEYLVSFEFADNGSPNFGVRTFSTPNKINSETLKDIRKEIKKCIKNQKRNCDSVIILNIVCLTDL